MMDALNTVNSALQWWPKELSEPLSRFAKNMGHTAKQNPAVFGTIACATIAAAGWVGYHAGKRDKWAKGERRDRDDAFGSYQR